MAKCKGISVFVIELLVYLHSTLVLGDCAALSIPLKRTLLSKEDASLSETTLFSTQSGQENSLSKTRLSQHSSNILSRNLRSTDSSFENEKKAAELNNKKLPSSEKQHVNGDQSGICCEKKVWSKRNVKQVLPKPRTDSNERLLTCSHVLGYYDHRLLNLVTSCPAGWTDQTTSRHCIFWDRMRFSTGANKLALLPVQDSNGTVFANVFCAICNSVDTVYPWTTSVDCDATQSVFDTDKDQDHNLPASNPVPLNISDVSSLMELPHTSSCRTKIIPSFPNAIQKCRGYTMYNPNWFARAMRPEIEYAETSSPTVSFNLLLNFDFKGDSHILYSTSEHVIKTEYISVGRCDEGEAYDTLYKRCRPIKCNKPFYRLMGHSCVLDDRYTSEDLNIFDSPYFDESTLMSLSINITLGSYVMLSSLGNLNHIMARQLAAILNIGEERIQHMNVTFDSEATQGTKAEIHRLNSLTPKLKKKLHIEGWDLDQYQDSSFENANSEQVKADKKNGGKEAFNSKESSVISEPNVSPRGGFAEKNTPNGNEGKESKLKEAGIRGKSTTHTFTPSKNSGSSNIGGATRPKFGTSSHMTTETPRNTTDPDDWGLSYLVDLVSMPVTMYVSFILTPASHPKGTDQRTHMLVKKISHLIKNNSLHISVKGKQLNVSGLHNTNTFDDEDERDEFCQWGRRMTLHNDKFRMFQINGTHYLYDTVDDRYFKQGFFNFFAIARGKNNKTATSLTHFEQYSVVCVMPRIAHADCRRIEITKDEYILSKDNMSIIFQENEYNMSMYTVQNITTGLVEICVPQSYNYGEHIVSPRILFIDKKCGSKFEKIREVESYLTTILGRVSTIALGLVFITYCLFPSLRTLPGCNIMNLTLALLLAEIVFMEDIFIQDTDWCAVVTIILHFLFLVAHFWMNVISFDVYRTFSKRKRTVVTRQDSVGKKCYYYPRYFLYAWGTPLIIVGMCIFIEYSNLFDAHIGYKKEQAPDLASNLPNNVSIKDGDETVLLQNISRIVEHALQYGPQVCWIQKPVVALVAFGAPVLLIFLTNCGFFIKTIFSVSRTVKESRENLSRQESSASIGNRSGRSEAMLYLRMSSVMGFTWVFAFTSSLISSVARSINTTICTLVYINSTLFTIFNISQGVFIFVSFLCNRRILQLYMKLLARWRRKIARRTHTSTIYSISSARGVDTKTE